VLYAKGKGELTEPRWDPRVDGKAVASGRPTGKPIVGAKLAKAGGRTAIVDAKGIELKDAKKGAASRLQSVRRLEGRGWRADLRLGPKGSDLFTEAKFQDFELHLEFLGTATAASICKAL